MIKTNELEEVYGSVEAVTNLIRAAKKAGCKKDQIENFLKAGYIPTQKALEYHAAARACDEPGGPTEVLIGGARGPGKTHMSFAQTALDDCQRYPGLKVLFLRKVGVSAAEQAEDLIIKILFATDHEFKPSKGRIDFPNGSKITLGHFKDESDIEKYQGREYDLIVIEEATQLNAFKHSTLGLSTRTTTYSGWRARKYLTANPGGIGHGYIKKRFVDPYRKNTQTTTRFIPAVVTDNPFATAEYIAELDALTGWEYRAYRLGDWDISAGSYFTNFLYETHVIEPVEIRPSWNEWFSLDYGWTHPTAVYKYAISDEGIIYTTSELFMARTHIEEISRIMKDEMGYDVNKHGYVLAGRDCFSVGENGSKTIAEQYEEYNVYLEPANTDRLSGASNMTRLLGDVDRGIEPKWYIFRNCTVLAEQMGNIQVDPRRPGDILKTDATAENPTAGDDAIDSNRYGLMNVIAAKKATKTAARREHKTTMMPSSPSEVF